MKKATTKKHREELPDDVSRLRGWRRARAVSGLTRAKAPMRRITINLDEDIIAIFQAQALRGGLPYQVAINLRDRERTETERAAEIVLKALEDEDVRERLRHLH